MKKAIATLIIIAFSSCFSCASKNNYTVNGIDPTPAEKKSFCEKNPAICIIGGAIIIGGVAYAVSESGSSDSTETKPEKPNSGGTL